MVLSSKALEMIYHMDSSSVGKFNFWETVFGQLCIGSSKGQSRSGRKGTAIQKEEKVTTTGDSVSIHKQSRNGTLNDTQDTGSKD